MKSILTPEDRVLKYCSKIQRFKKTISENSSHKINKKGTYRKKCEFGVLTIHFSNTKLRDSIVSAISTLQEKPS